MSTLRTKTLICPTCREDEKFVRTPTGYRCSACGESMIETDEPV